MTEFDELMRLLGTRALSSGVRLGILIALYVVDGYITFADFQRALDIPKSTLHEHLQILAREGYIEYKRAITERGVRAVAKITDKGRGIVRRYLDLLRRIYQKQGEPP
ncbi:transcriptional regulator, ArsR family [Pyrobaculum islandicum DSM 4184]|uniref:Transcriptional regulator, ArsR family n=1 Tax=Pyrobaculum islandicum (strain DSM 4184 / JCM 9189 / GEO3) TaxID=384616 RepID=A1RQY4_PYRIL|nr:transcriptional regulator [Pyrobaculum islandicum]ABL87366.1 transcriptional regulator, ArsR family [Pyrobaculum islandicum DSM 4184]